MPNCRVRQSLVAAAILMLSQSGDPAHAITPVGIGEALSAKLTEYSVDATEREAQVKRFIGGNGHKAIAIAVKAKHT